MSSVVALFGPRSLPRRSRRRVAKTEVTVLVQNQSVFSVCFRLLRGSVFCPWWRFSLPSVRRKRHPPPTGPSSAATRGSPASRRARFRPRCRLRWTYEADDAIESSAAIADGVVYVGVGKRRPAGDRSRLGQAALEVHDRQHDRRIVAGRRRRTSSSSAISAASSTPCARSDGSRLWTFKTGSEVKSSPTIVDDLVLIGSYDTHLYALDAATGKLRWKLQTERSGPRHAGGRRTASSTSPGATRSSARVRLTDGKMLFRDAARRLHRRVAGRRRRSRLLRHVQLRGHRGRSDARGRSSWRYQRSRSRVPVLFVAGVSRSGRVIVGGRDKAVHAIDAATGKGVWKFVTRARVDSSPVVAGGRVYVGIERRQAVRARRRDRSEAVGIRRRRRDHRFAGRCRGTRRDRRAGRPHLLLRVEWTRTN